jgi:hypothetical protein
MVIPKMNINAKSPDEVFKFEDFFAPEELPLYLTHAKPLFNGYSTLDKICELSNFQQLLQLNII